MSRRENVRDRISKQDFDDLKSRRVTVKAMAQKLKVSPNYLSHAIPERLPKKNSKLLAKLRKLHQQQVAREVREGKHTVFRGAQLACVSERTMYRILAKLETV